MGLIANDLVVSLSYLQSSDNTKIQITDTTGTYDVADNADGWGDPNPISPFVVATDIVQSTDVTAGHVHLLMDITHTDSSNVVTAFDQLNMYDVALAHDVTFTGFATTADLVWEISAADLLVAGTALGTETTELPDGFWTFTYTIATSDSVAHADYYYILSEGTFVDGIVRTKVYSVLRQIPNIYEYRMAANYTYNPDFEDILDALEKYAIFKGMLANISDATDEDVLNVLYTLEQLTIND